MLKEALYPCWGAGYPGLPDFNRVVYVVVGDCCYFSGIEREKRTSTINAAESIIQEIATLEGLAVYATRWFDLQTCRGYKGIPGTFRLDELILDEKPHGASEGGVVETEIGDEQVLISTQGSKHFLVQSWRPTECPSEVRELFKEHIGELRKK